MNSWAARQSACAAFDAGMIQAKKLEGDYGYVGDITHINTEPIENAIANGYIPVIATVGTDLDGNVYNINADTAAAEIATALQAENIITLTDIRGLLQDVDDPDSLISTVTMDDIPALMERGIISGGMIPKIKGLEAAIKAGVKKAVMIDGRIEHSILIEIFSDEGIGTMFTNKKHGKARKEGISMSFEDIKNWMTLMSCTPMGDTIWQSTTARAQSVMTLPANPILTSPAASG